MQRQSLPGIVTAGQLFTHVPNRSNTNLLKDDPLDNQLHNAAI